MSGSNGKENENTGYRCLCVRGLQQGLKYAGSDIDSNSPPSRNSDRQRGDSLRNLEASRLGTGEVAGQSTTRVISILVTPMNSAPLIHLPAPWRLQASTSAHRQAAAAAEQRAHAAHAAADASRRHLDEAPLSERVLREQEVRRLQLAADHAAAEAIAAAAAVEEAHPGDADSTKLNGRYSPRSGLSEGLLTAEVALDGHGHPLQGDGDSVNLEPSQQFVWPLILPPIVLDDPDHARADVRSVNDSFGFHRSAPMSCLIKVEVGRLALPVISGLSFLAGRGRDDRVISLRGPVEALNRALNAVEYTCRSRADGCRRGLLDTMSLLLDDEGFSGAGGRLTASRVIRIELPLLDGDGTSNPSAESKTGEYTMMTEEENGKEEEKDGNAEGILPHGDHEASAVLANEEANPLAPQGNDFTGYKRLY